MEITLLLILVTITLCQGQNTDYPCLSRRCKREETCYPVVRYCNNDRCHFNSICLDHEKHLSPCEFGFPVLRANNTPHFCENNGGCPKATRCHHSDFYRVSVCCWESQQVARKQKPRNCPNVGRNVSCFDECRRDSHCSNGKECCYNGCGHDCIDRQLTLVNTERPGHCPTERPTTFMCSLRKKCSRDTDCFGYYKCCSVSGCGKICRPPTRAKSRKTITPLAEGRDSSRGKDGSNQSQARLPVYKETSDCPWFRRIYGGCITRKD